MSLSKNTVGKKTPTEMSTLGQSEDRLCESLSNVPTSMETFSKSLRALYAEKKVSSTSENATQINLIRDDMKKYGMVYVKLIHPFSTKVVQSLSDFVDLFNILKFDKWKENLDQWIKDINGYAQFCDVTVKMYVKITANLKACQDDASVLLGKIDDKTKYYVARKSLNNTTAAAGVTTAVGSGAAFGLGLLGATAFWVTIPIAAGVSVYSLTKASHLESQRLLSENDAEKLRIYMIESMEKFIKTLEEIGSFFELNEKYLKSMADCQRGFDNNYYKIMRAKSSRLIKNCNEILQTTPKVLSDLMSIPESHTEKWLAEKHSELSLDQLDVKLTKELGEQILQLLSTDEKEIRIQSKRRET